MQLVQPHILTLACTRADGAEEWHCQSCEHRILIDWAGPQLTTILAPGNTEVSHVGGYTNQQQLIERAVPQATPSSLQQSVFIHEELGTIPVTDMLAPWLRWMQKVGLARD